MSSSEDGLEKKCIYFLLCIVIGAMLFAIRVPIKNMFTNQVAPPRDFDDSRSFPYNGEDFYFKNFSHIIDPPQPRVGQVATMIITIDPYSDIDSNPKSKPFVDEMKKKIPNYSLSNESIQIQFSFLCYGASQYGSDVTLLTRNPIVSQNESGICINWKLANRNRIVMRIQLKFSGVGKHVVDISGGMHSRPDNILLPGPGFFKQHAMPFEVVR